MRRFGIRSHLLASFLLAVLVPALVTLLAAGYFFHTQVVQQAKTAVRMNLNAARGIFDQERARLAQLVRLIAHQQSLQSRLEGEAQGDLGELLSPVLRDEHLHLLGVCDPQGRVLFRAHNPDAAGDDLRELFLIQEALRTWSPRSGTSLLDGRQLLRESPDLARRARMQLRDTPRAKPREDTQEERGMVVLAVSPIIRPDGSLAGCLYGGVLLNRNYGIVDQVKRTVFEESRYEGRDTGTATIFLDDLRIATNVLRQDGQRAIGTRVSEEVNDAVLVRGETWVGEAFVVNDWYITSYEPIRDPRGTVIGSLYVGILRQPFDDLLTRTLGVFLAVSLMGMAIVSLVAIRQAGAISRPILSIARAARRIAGGELDLRLEGDAPGEVTYLAESFNSMADQLQETLGQLRSWGETQEQKVEERSAELAQIQSHLIHTEKLVSLGKLAAGVAHEINNPLTTILTHSCLLLEDQPEGSPAIRQLEAMKTETLRCREIVKGLLNFARQADLRMEEQDLNQLIRGTVELLASQADFLSVKFETDLDPKIPRLLLDRDQIQQVMMNILINASEAMGHRGPIEISTRPVQGNKGVEIRIADQGPGIPAEYLKRIFDPFFTTKETGTGLGLAISFGIVEKHRGSVRVDSREGQGTTFFIELPRLAPMALMEQA